MSISIKCGCGKVFKVKDELKGREVMCQVCRGVIRVPAEPPSGRSSEDGVRAPARVPTRPAPAAAAPARVSSTRMMECPACAEPIPVSSEKCPYCSELLKRHADADEKKERLAGLVRNLETYAANPSNLAADEKLPGGLLSVRTIVLAAVMAVSAAMAVGGASIGVDKGGALLGIGIGCAIIFVIPFLVCLVNDYRCSHIQDAGTPVRAFRRYFDALRTGRTGKAYACLAPQARRSGAVEPVDFNIIPGSDGPRTIDDLGSFEKYWKNVLKSPAGQVRSVRLRHPREVQNNPDGVVLVEADLHFTSYSPWWYLTIFINLLVCLIVIVAVQKKETMTLSKLLVSRGGRWYVAEAEFEGVLDDTRAMP